MKPINKEKEPATLLTYRKQPDATYENYREKEVLREALLKEQGHICCYCMQRVTKEEMKIEHWQPQSEYPELQLDYGNLLASCKGNEGQPTERQHCDTRKGNQALTIHPAKLPTHWEELIKFRRDGRIYSDDLSLDRELNEVLNLNLDTLVNNRSEIIDQIKEYLTRIEGKKAGWRIQDVKKRIAEYEGKIDGKYKPYCQVVIAFLKKRFAKELNSSPTRN